jgi:hypothetical protein
LISAEILSGEIAEIVAQAAVVKGPDGLFGAGRKFW